MTFISFSRSLWHFKNLDRKKLVSLDFSDLDFIFKVMPALWNLNFDKKKFYALCGCVCVCVGGGGGGGIE